MSDNKIKNKAISGVIWKGMERLAGQLVSSIVAIILARILMPDDYSVVSIVAIFFVFCEIFISGGLNTALIQKKNADIIDYSTILISNLVMALILYIIMWFCASRIAMLYKKVILIPIIRVMAINFFFIAYKGVVSAKIIADLQFKKFFMSSIWGTLMSAVIGITMAINGYGPWALIAQQMVHTFIAALILTFTSRIKFELKFNFERFKSLFSFGGKILLSSIIHEIYNQTKPLIVGIKYSSIDLAYYNKGKTYPDLIANTSNDTLSFSLFPALSKIQDDKSAVLNMVRRFMQLSSFFVFPTMFGFLAISENFVRIILTDKWMPIVPYIMIFCISGMFKPIQSGNLMAIRAIGRSDILLKLEILKKSLYYIVIICFLLFSKGPVLLAISGIITAIIASIINIYPNKKLFGYGYRKQFQDLFLNFLISAIMGGAVIVIKFVKINIFISFIIQIISGVLIFIGLNILFKNENMSYAFAVAKAFLNKK